MHEAHEVALDDLGKTLILLSSQQRAPGAPIMFALIARISRFLRPAAARRQSVARSLLESAEARAGLNPHQARELREAARAYLSVVR
jgi:hypothetical protein